jgi:hypothetical protein
MEDVPTEVLSESRLLTWWMIGPKTRGGLMVTPSKFGFSSLMNFQNAFSARVFEAVYQQTSRLKDEVKLPLYLSPPGASRPFSSQTPALYSFQSFSVNLYVSLFD